jgi:hypothetical protein
MNELQGKDGAMGNIVRRNSRYKALLDRLAA